MATTTTATANLPSYTVTEASCVDLSKPSGVISTGIGFFDHMIDQLNSHAQIGVSIVVEKDGGGSGRSGGDDENDRNRFADPLEGQGVLVGTVGSALGSQLKKIWIDKGLTGGSTSRFCCPLDEALVECVLSVPTSSDDGGKLTSFALAPYGIYPAGKGRSQIGKLMTAHVETFFDELAKSVGLRLSLIKLRGKNGHHVVESAFKAFSRAFRTLLDGAGPEDNDDDDCDAMQRLWGPESDGYKAGLDLNRSGRVSRKTKETSIDVRLEMSGGKTGGPGSGVRVSTGCKTYETFVANLAIQALWTLEVNCVGDLWVDDHHTVEDVSIAIGQALNAALGDKAGLNRMWCAVGRCGDAEVEVTMDLSNRPYLAHDLSLSSNPNGEEYVEDEVDDGNKLSIEMFEHALGSLVSSSRMTVHVVEQKVGKSVKETVLATAIAFGKALKFCSAVDPRRAGRTASSKGTLSA